MENSLKKLLQGYQQFRDKYVLGDNAIMQYLSSNGQQPQVMVVSCCDSRVDPALLLQCDPGDLFVVRNVANIIPPYEKDVTHHGTSAALEFGICFLNVKHLILLGHSQCGGIQILLNPSHHQENDFISNWVSVIQSEHEYLDPDEYAKFALNQSLQNCNTFPWIKQKLQEKQLSIHRWFFDVKTGQIFSFCHTQNKYCPLDSIETLKDLSLAS